LRAMLRPVRRDSVRVPSQGRCGQPRKHERHRTAGEGPPNKSRINTAHDRATPCGDPVDSRKLTDRRAVVPRHLKRHVKANPRDPGLTPKGGCVGLMSYPWALQGSRTELRLSGESGCCLLAGRSCACGTERAFLKIQGSGTKLCCCRALFRRRDGRVRGDGVARG
jgi:hypothetical protein